MAHSSKFSQEELKRYKRHFSLNSVGHEGQIKLKEARVLCIGAGGLGSSLLLYLAGAGIGTLGIIDNDAVDISNLQRQILFTTDDIKKNKALTAKEKLTKLNPNTDLKVYEYRLTAENAKEIFSQYDIIADGSDNFETRHLVNHTCFALQKVNVSASVSEFKGQCTVFAPQDPCYYCLFPANNGEEQLLNCRERGILGVLPGIFGTIQATEVIKWILGIGTPLVGKLLQIDVLDLDYRIYTFSKNPACYLCNSRELELPPFSYMKHSSCFSEILITPHELQEYINAAEVFLLDVREPDEYSNYNLGGINIPLSQLPGCLEVPKKYKLIVTYCQLGQRSLQAVRILNRFGFSQVKSLSGGIQAWLEETA